MEEYTILIQYYNKERILNYFDLQIKKIAYNSVNVKTMDCFLKTQEVVEKKLKFLKYCEKISEILNGLEKDEREIFDNIIGGNKTYDEVAEILNIGIRTVYRKMRKAQLKIELKIRGIDSEKYNSK